MSTADCGRACRWPLSSTARPDRPVPRMLVSGIDDPPARQRPRSRAPAGFSRATDLERAVLAVRMNGAPLPRRPRRSGPPGRSRLVRLRVHQMGGPHRAGRRRCAGDNADAGVRGADASALRSAQWRLAQGRDPAALARDFVPATIDTAAMPVRVEKWRVDGRLEYRITGIIWGGSTPTNALSIRFKSGGPWTRVERLPAAGVDADVEPVDAHLAAGRAGALPDRPARGRSVDPHAAAGSVFLRAGNRNRRRCRGGSRTAPTSRDELASARSCSAAL